MLVSSIVTIFFNAVVFYGLSHVLPGFEIKKESTALSVAFFYSLLMLVATLIAIPLIFIGGIFLAILAFIPLIGPLIAGVTGITMLLALLVSCFCVSMVSLMLIDKLMDSFKMKYTGTVIIASVVMAFANLGAKLLLPL